MEKIAEYSISRAKAAAFAVIIGCVIGAANVWLEPIDFTPDMSLAAWLLAGFCLTVFLHEAVHGATAVLFGHKPLFGFKPPLVYVTFTAKIPRGRFVAICLAPLILLDIVFGILFAFSILRELSYFVLVVNTVGAIGDVWMTVKLIPHARGTLVQDTKNGIEVYREA